MAVTIRKTEESDRAILDGFFKESFPHRDAESNVHPRRNSLEQSYWFVILADGKIVGEIGIEEPSSCRSTYTVGFTVGRPYWNRGYCTEALKQLVRFAFDELKLYRLEGDCDFDNPASGRIFEKAGFTKEGILEEQVYKRGVYINRILWGLINPSPEGR